MALLAAVVAVYLPVLGHGFVALDDAGYVFENQRVLSGLSLDGAAWAFTTFERSNWHPLTWLSLMLDAELHGDRAWGYHLTNLLLHSANVLLLFGLLRQLTGSTWRAGFAAGLFAVHPLHVESVAWVSERKDVLSLTFGLSSMLAWVSWTRRGGVLRYLLAAGSLALGLMAKPMLVTLPFLFLLLDIWPLGRLRLPPLERMLEKLPLSALAAASAIVTLLAQREALRPLETHPLAARTANAVLAYGAYLRKAIWPTDLAAFYPYPSTIFAWKVAATGLLLAGITVAALRATARYPYLAVGWLWFLGALVPVSGLIQVGGQSMADRYAYLPLIGVWLAAAWGLGDLARARPRARRLAAVVAVLALADYAVTARAQVGTWRDTRTLMEHALRVTPDNPMAHFLLGVDLQERGALEAAAEHYRRSLDLAPRDADVHNNLGVVLHRLGRLDLARAHYERAIELHPGHARAHNNLGVLYQSRGDTTRAERHFRDAVRGDPDYADAHAGLGGVLESLGRGAEAASEYAIAARLRPGHPAARAGLERLRGRTSGN